MSVVLRWWGAVLLACLMAGCGGGGDSASGVAVIPARAGAADIGPAGGSVSAVFEGGAAITLTVPAGAVAATTTFRIDPATAPSDALGAMSMSPAGLVFSKPATLSVTLPAGSDASGLIGAFDIEGRRVPIGAFDAATRTMTVELRYLGTGAAEPSITGQSAGRATALSARSQPQGVVPHNQVVQMLLQRGDLVATLFAFHNFVDTLSKVGSRDNAIVVEEAFGAVLAQGINRAGPVDKNQVAIDGVTWGNVVCGQLTFAVSTITGLSASTSPSSPAFAQAVQDVIAWGFLMKEFNDLVGQLNFPIGVSCPALQADIAAPIRATFPAFLRGLTSSLALLSPRQDFDQLLNARVPELINLDAVLRLVGTVDDLAAQVQALAVTQLLELRVGAYDECRFNQKQLLQRDLLVKLVSDRSFDAIKPYGETDLFADLEYCGMPVAWELRDTQGTVLRSGTVGGSTTAGTSTATATLDMTGADKLVIKGPLSALMCPGSAAGATTTVSPHANNEQLGFNAGPLGGILSSVGLLTPANDSRYLEVSNLELPVAQLKTLAQPTGSGNGELSIQRQGDTCAGEFPNFSQHRRLVKFELGFNVIHITTTSLPTATVNVGYSAALVATGGALPLTWTATGLPAGMSLDAAAGVISGTPSAAGSFTAVVDATGADGSVASKALTLIVLPPSPAGSYVGTMTHSFNGQTNSRPYGPVAVLQRGSQLFIDGYIFELTPAGGLNFLGFSAGGVGTATGFDIIDPSNTIYTQYAVSASINGGQLTYTERQIDQGCAQGTSTFCSVDTFVGVRQ